MQPLAWKAYDNASDHFFEAYESLKFSDAHRSFLRFLPAKGALCLDVGAGSGRDAAALARRGYRVTAVEPSDGLRGLAMTRHADAKITWVDDALPHLSKVISLKTRYDFILLSAVWMHIPSFDRIPSLRTLKHLLSADGHIAFTLKTGVPSDSRVMYPVSVDELLQHATQVGLKAVYVSRTTRDSLKRSQVGWIKVVLGTAPVA